MSNYTTYKALEKPLSTEKYNIAVANRNADLIDTELNKLEQKDLSLDEALTAESDRAKDAESKLTDALEAEVQRAQTAENANAEAIRTERMRSSNAEADLQSNLEDEINRSQAAEQLLDTGLNTVTESVNAVDSRVTALDEKVDGLSAEDIGAVTPEELSSYLPLQGGTLTGPLKVQGTVTATDFAGNASSASKSASSEMLTGWEDTRNTATKPNDYNEKIRPVGIKQNTTTGIPDGGTYTTLVGIRGWKDSSGGKAHELGFTANGKLYHRVGDTDTWEPWRELAHKDDIAASSGTNEISSKVSKSGDIMTGNLLFSDSGTGFRGIQGAMGGNDAWRMMGGATGSNAGFLDIATADDGTEPIYVDQYSGNFATLAARATLLDTNHNTAFPGTVTGKLFSVPEGHAQISRTGLYAGTLKDLVEQIMFDPNARSSAGNVKVTSDILGNGITGWFKYMATWQNAYNQNNYDIGLTLILNEAIASETMWRISIDGKNGSYNITRKDHMEFGSDGTLKVPSNTQAFTCVLYQRVDAYDQKSYAVYANTKHDHYYLLVGAAAASTATTIKNTDFFRVTFIHFDEGSSSANYWTTFHLGTSGTVDSGRFSVDKTCSNITISVAKGAYAELSLYEISIR